MGELEFNDKRRCGAVKDTQSTQRMWASLCRGRVQHGADKGICWTSTAGVGAFFHVPRVLLLFVVLDGYAQRTAYCPAGKEDDVTVAVGLVTLFKTSFPGVRPCFWSLLCCWLECSK